VSFIETVRRARELLRSEGRISLRALKREFALDDEALEALVEELVSIQRVAQREGPALVWAGGAAPAPQDAADTPDREHEAAEPEAELRQLTVLFCDLADSTELASGLDPEDWREVVGLYHESCVEVIQRYGGHVAQYLGDGILAYFGYPQAHEDDPIRAVTAAIGILAGIERCSAAIRQRVAAMGDRAIAVRLGVHTGRVVVGSIGSGASHELQAQGDTPNVAARLQAVAAPNTAVISEATRRLIAGVFVLEDLGPMQLKGLAETLRAYRPLRVSGAGRGPDAAPASELTTFVGREQELGLLRGCWERARQRSGQVVLLSGDPGMGKSRLVQVLREQLADEPHSWLEVRGSVHAQHSPLHATIDLLTPALLFAPDDPPQVRVAKLEQALETAGFSLAEQMPLFASLLSLPLPEHYAPLGLSPEAQRRKTLETLHQWLFQLAEIQPMVLAVEDLQWLDPSTLELLGLAVDQAPTVPLLLLVTMRSDFEAPWGQRGHISHLTLHPLSRGQVRAMVDSITGGKPLPAPVLDQLVGKTDGVPLFVEELTKMVLESGLLVEKADGYELSGPLPPLAIPNTLQDSLMARLDRLSDVKGVAQTAATIGREVPYELLREVTQLAEPALRNALEQLVASEVLHQHGLPPRATYSFRHALIQETAYQSLLKSRRQQVHQQVAIALQEKLPDTVARQPELLARHLEQAGLAERAIDSWERAGTQAAAVSAHAEAITHLERALGLLKELPDAPNRKERELVLQVALGASALAVKGWGSAEVEAVYRRARDLCRGVDQRDRLAQALWGLVGFYMVRSELETAMALARELLARGEGDPAFTMMGHLGLAQVLLWRGEYPEAAHHAEATIALYRAEEHASLAYVYGEDPGTTSRAFGAIALWCLGHPDRSRQMSDEAVELAREHAHPFSLAFALSFAANLRQMLRVPDAARELAEESVALSAKQSFPVFEGASRLTRGWVAAADGDEQGLPELQRGLAQLAPTGTDAAAPFFLSLVVDANRKLHRVEDAAGALELALAVAADKNAPFWSAELFRLKGELMLLGDANAAEAEPQFRRALELARQQSARSFELRAATSLARLWQRRGQLTEARDLLAPIHGWFTEGFDTPDLRDATTLLEELS
jgi:class 3 adenylate cyclase/tetratricopeptide (TPR) repeat protein